MTAEKPPAPGDVLLYFTGIFVASTAAALGLFLHWTAAVTGPGIGLFGIDAWAGAFVGLALALIGVWTWRKGGRHIGSKTKLAGRIAVMATFGAAVFVSTDLLATSWSATCEENRPVVCYHLGSLSETDTNESRQFLHTACTGGHIDGCQQLIEEFSESSSLEEACRMALETCRRARRCEAPDTPARCRLFEQPVTLPRPGIEQCAMLADHCDVESPRPKSRPKYPSRSFR